MDYSRIEQEGLIQAVERDDSVIDMSIKLAERDLQTAGSLVTDNADWAYSIAYNCMLQAARALMHYKGFRPSGPNRHLTIVRFLELTLDEDIVLGFDRMRRKRHQVVYDITGAVSDTEAKNAVKRAQRFLDEIQQEIKG